MLATSVWIDCAARVISTRVGVVDFDRYELSLALVTETRHDPEDVDVSVPFCTEQPVAKPSMAIKLN
jgi:hypothetical protein